MSSKQHLWVAILAMVAILGVGGAVLAWPTYREAASLDQQAAALRRKGENYDVQVNEIAQLTAHLEDATHRVDSEFKDVPAAPDIAGLMRVLSLPVDGEHVRDQTFTAGRPKAAVPGSELTAMVVALTVEMDARFESIFALIRVAESMHRLVRVTSVNIVCDGQETVDERFGRATVVLEAVYDPEEPGGSS